MPQMICLSGLHKGQVYDLPLGEMTLGRGDRNPIVCMDAKASRVHCKIAFDGQYLVVEDLQSTNGTRVNNVYITEPRYLQQGDHIQVGQSIFRIYVTDQEPPVFDPAMVPADSPYVFTQTSAIRKNYLGRTQSDLGYIAYVTAQ